MVPRTNNVEESLFRTIKRQCRRLHGRGHLRRDLDDMFEAAPLVLNLTNADYCETVYGGTDVESIARRFSILSIASASKTSMRGRRIWRPGIVCEARFRSLEANGRSNLEGIPNLLRER